MRTASSLAVVQSAEQLIVILGVLLAAMTVLEWPPVLKVVGFVVWVTVQPQVASSAALLVEK